MPKRRTVGDLLSRAKTQESRFAHAKTWAQEWFSEQAALLRKLRASVMQQDRAGALFYLQQLEATNEKRHGALQRVFDALEKGEEKNVGKPRNPDSDRV